MDAGQGAAIRVEVFGHGPAEKPILLGRVGDEQGFRKQCGKPAGDGLDQGVALMEGQGLVASEARAFSARQNHPGNLVDPLGHSCGSWRMVMMISRGSWHPLSEQVMPVMAWRRKLSTKALR